MMEIANQWTGVSMIGNSVMKELKAKEIFRNICDGKILSDKKLAPSMKRKWIAWEQDLPRFIEISRAITNINEKLLEIKIRLFGDESIIGTSAIAYAVIK